MNLKLCLLLGFATFVAWIPEGCHGNNDPEWWKHAIVYQVYPLSFQDSNDDGVGDLQGVISRLDHLVDLGVGAVWLSPIYRSPMKDCSYDISDHQDIDPVFGTMEDFDQLLEEVHKRGLKLILDFVPNHTSDQHPWFKASVTQDKLGKYNDWYIWKKPKYDAEGLSVIGGSAWTWSEERNMYYLHQYHPPQPDLNYRNRDVIKSMQLSVFGGGAWTWSEERGMYYLHQFDPAQPDLNYRNRDVIKGMQDVLSFWIKKGVDGFRIDAIHTLFENNYEEDEPLSNIEGVLPMDYEYLDHINTAHQPQIHGVVRDWRKLFDEWKKRRGKEIFMVMEVYDESLVESMKYYESGADMPFNFLLLFMNDTCGGSCAAQIIAHWMSNMPEDKWPNFVTGNHDTKRMTTKKGAQYASVMNMLLLLLPGTPTTYQGEEIGMLDNNYISYEETVDPWGRNFGPEHYQEKTRDPCRAPVQWNSDKNAGFSRADKTWLPVHPDYKTHNIKDQRNDPSGNSVLQIYRKAAKLRKKSAFRNNRLFFIVTNENIISFIRYDPDGIGYLVALNIGKNTSTDDYYGAILQPNYKESGTIVLNSGNIERDVFKVGNTVNLNEITLKPAEGIVVEIYRKDKPKDEL